MGWDNYRLMRKKKKKERWGETKEKNNTAKRINKAKQVVHNVIAHNPMIDAQSKFLVKFFLHSLQVLKIKYI